MVSEETKQLPAVWFKCTEPACLMVAQSILPARAKTLLESWSRTRKAVHSPAAAAAVAEAVGKGQMGI